MAWQGSKADRGELIRDLMCFTNTPSGGHILIGVEEDPAGWTRVGVSERQAETFDPSKIGDLAAGYCSVLPVFRIWREPLDGKLYVLIVVEEFEDQPIVCTRDLHGSSNELILRAGALYTRTVDAKCTEVRTPENMQRLLDLAVRKRGDVLLSQIASLVEGRGSIPESDSDEERFAHQRDAAVSFFEDEALSGSYWQVELRPERFSERLIETRGDLQRIRADAEVALRGWNFPHADRERLGSLTDGIYSLTRWAVHHEAFRIFLSGLFVWRKLLREDFEEARFHRKLLYESTIWSLTEIWLFASRYLASFVETGNVSVGIGLHGLKGRELVAGRPDVSVWPSQVSQEDVYRRHRTMPIGEVRARHLEFAAMDAVDLFELFGPHVSMQAISSWQDKLLKREF